MSGINIYVGTGERWPYSTGNGHDKDQEMAGKRSWKVEVRADSLQEAVGLIDLYRQGIETDQHVWKAPITKVEQVSN